VLEREAWRRATGGREEPVFYNGQQVGTIRKTVRLAADFCAESAKALNVSRAARGRYTANVDVASSVNVIHEYRDSRSAIEVMQLGGVEAESFAAHIDGRRRSDRQFRRDGLAGAVSR
jgi:hypothetical protein